MTATGLALLLTAASIGAVHTLLGPDHYIPFVAMARAGGWSLRRALVTTSLCGLAHVLSSAALGAVGMALGVAALKLELIESFRGTVAGWLLLGFGVAYFAWGVRQGIRKRGHAHVHVHADGTIHAHTHTHEDAHVHSHGASMSHWVLFTIFLFGPCEPLIPLLMYAGAEGGVALAAIVMLVFGATTIAVMSGVVALALLGAEAFPAKRGPFGRALAPFDHALAGLLILACGAAIQVGL